MKDIKSFIIGFLTCTCMFLLMGQDKFTPSHKMGVVGKYLGFADHNGNLYKMNSITGETEIRWTGNRKQDWERY